VDDGSEVYVVPDIGRSLFRFLKDQMGRPMKSTARGLHAGANYGAFIYKSGAAGSANWVVEGKAGEEAEKAGV
jgi:hypothetical protein